MVQHAYEGDVDLMVYSRPAEAAFEAGKYDEAKQMYFEYATMVVGSDFEIPLAGGIGEGGVRCSMYTKMGQLKKVYLMGCCNGIAQCLILMNDIEGVSAFSEPSFWSMIVSRFT